MKEEFNLSKSEKGSIIILVLATMLLFLVVTFFAYTNLSIKEIEQKHKLEKIAEEYQSGKNELDINMKMEEDYQYILSKQNFNYVVDDTNYCNSLAEALEVAQNGSIIKVLKNTQELIDNQALDINKNLTIDTNGNTINCSGNYCQLVVESEYELNIIGNGSMASNYSNCSFIVNNGTLVVDNVTISSPIDVGQLGTISSDGTVNINGGKIIGTFYVRNGTANINGGTFGTIQPSQFSNVSLITIENAEKISYINLSNGGNLTIKGGNIEKIYLGSNHFDINLTIGDINKAVNTNNPTIQSVEISPNGLVGIYTEINFLNGIVKEGFEDDLSDFIASEGGSFNVRTGYTISTTSDGTILVAK